MSHQPERKEKDCLNCGVEVLGPYCQNCGQKNTVVHQTFWQLITHFVYDIFHFDGKFFDTLKYLLFKPGFVPKQYIAGRRQSYLDPIRMYLFTSAVFFLVFYSVSKTGTDFVFENDRILSKEERFEAAAQIYTQQEEWPPDTTANKKLALLLDTTKSVRMVRVTDQVVPDSGNLILLRNNRYLISPVSNSLINSESGRKINWLQNRIDTIWKKFKKQYGDDVNKMFHDTVNRFVHWFPYMLFASLPLFALLLKLLYRRRKNYYYSDHAVFTLYHYIFSFILLMLFWGSEALHKWTGLGVFNLLQTGLIAAWVLYLFFSMKRFYSQSIGKTFIKFLLVNFLGFLSLVLIFVCFTILFISQL